MFQTITALLDFASPFHVCCDREWNVVCVGPSMAEHLDSDPIGHPLADMLSFQRPKLDGPTGLNNLAGQLVLLRIKHSGLDLRGQWNDMPWPGLDSGDAGRVLLCSPWVTGEDQWRKTGLKLRQLGPQDGSGEYLLLLAAAREQALDVARLADLANARGNVLEALVQRMREGLLLIDNEGRIESANPAASALLGRRTNEIEHMPLGEFFTKLPSLEDSSEDIEWEVQKKNGGSFKARGSRYGITTPGKHSEALLFRDVSEEEQTLQMRRTFLSMVSHELRTPLTAIKAPLGMSLSGHLGELSPKVRDVLKIATRNADRLHQLVDDVIDLERLESNALPMTPSEFKSSELAQKLRIPELVAQLLYNRNVADFESAQQFLQPSLNDLIEPDRLTGIAPAVARIRRAMDADEKIVLYGDYDVDGITGVAMLWHCLRLAGREVEYYVPHRIDEGYGLNCAAIESLIAKGAQLIITVDCGVTAHRAAQRTAELGADLIITDHHQLEGDLPPAIAVVHPDLPDQDYPNHNLCGAGAAFKLSWALAQSFSGARKVSDDFREFLLNATSLTALGTVADVVPLLGENRILARFGMQGLATSTDPGIAALIEAAGLRGERLQSSDIGFRLAPRLNAAGRMGHARLAVELLTCPNPTRAKEIATYLESQNNQRQKAQKELTAEAEAQVVKLGMDKPDHRGIVVAGEKWHAGIIGIVAGRIADKFHRPAIVMSLDNDKATGSCRSIPGFDLCAALQACAERLTTFGGHAMAAGLTLPLANLDAFRQAFNEYAASHLGDDDLTGFLDIDAEATIEQLNISLLEMIARLQPFGQSNPPVLLVARSLHLTSPPRRVGKASDHLQLTVARADDDHATLRPGAMIRGIGFGLAKWEKKLIDAQSFDLVFEPTINRFNGNQTVEMLVKDIKIND